MDAWWHDLRFALRTAVRRPAFLLGATLSLALAIGANTAIFSLINELFLRSLPVVAPERVFNITTVDERLGGPAGGRPLSHLNWRDVRDQSTAFEAVAGYDFVGLALDTGVGEPGVVPGLMVSANYFDVLGLKPAYGRFFRPEDDAGPGSGPVVVLRHGYFRDELGGDPDVIGRSLRINGQPVTVVGVAGPGFDGLNVGFEPALWAPMSMHRTLRPNPAINWYDERRGLFLVAFGRLAPGVTPESARAEVETIASRLERDYPDDNQGRGLALEPVSSNAVFNRGAVATGTALLAATVGLVLLVAAANVANLLLARASERRQEIAIRLAMGISRQRLLRQLLTESVMIAVLGGGLGLLLAILSRGWLAGILGNLPAGGNLALDLTLDRNVLLFNLLVSLATGFLFGLIPAIQFSRPQLVAAIREASAPTLAPGHRFAARDALVVAQLALSAVALVGAGLFLRSLAAGSRIDLGYPSQGLATLGFDVGLQGLGPAEAEPLFRQVRESVAALPGVSATALVQAGPLQGTLFRSVVLEGSNDQERTYVQVSAAGSGYFETMGIALERGRAIDERDRAGGQPVVVINSAMAERYWPGQDPLGQRFRFFGMEPVEVVGVAETISYNAPGEDPQPYAYLPLDQYYVTNMTLMARTQGDPESILRAAREELRRLDPGMVVNANTVNGILADAMTGQRTTASLLGVLGALALLIAGIGIYGVIAFAARTRRREIGIRMALGAAAPRIVGMLLGRGLLLSAAGLLLGTAIASVAMRPMRDLLFVSPHDPLTFGTIAVVLLLAALLSCAVPAWRAGRLSPMAVLRER